MNRHTPWSAAALALFAAAVPGQTFVRNLPDQPGLFTAMDIAVDGAGSAWVACWQTSQLVKLDPSGNELLRTGPQIRYSGMGLDVLSAPMAIEPGPLGDVYVADGQRIWRFAGAGNFLNGFGGPGSGNGQFKGPAGDIAAAPNGDVYVVDRCAGAPNDTDGSTACGTPANSAGVAGLIAVELWIDGAMAGTSAVRVKG